MNVQGSVASLPNGSHNGSVPITTGGELVLVEDVTEPNGPVLGGYGYLPSQTIRKAFSELGESSDVKKACLKALRQLIDKHQSENDFDEHTDAFLLKFLRHRKYNVEGAYELLSHYYNNRESKPEIFRNLTKKNVKKTLGQGIVGVLPQRDKKGRVLVEFNFNGWNMSLPFHFEKVLRVCVFTLEKLFESDETQINGIVIICDLSQLSILQTKSLGAAMITKILNLFYDNFPFRLSATHLLNPPWHFKLLWKVTNPMSYIRRKTVQRIYIHDGDLTRFYSEFEPSILPTNLGGTGAAYDNALWIQELLQPEPQILNHAQLQNSLQVNSKRSGLDR